MVRSERAAGGCDSLDVAALWPASAQQCGFEIPHVARDCDERPASEEEADNDGIW